jgi:hypothetical protein
LYTRRIEAESSSLNAYAAIKPKSLSVIALMRGGDISRHAEEVPRARPTLAAISRTLSTLSLRWAALASQGAPISIAPTKTN